MKKAAVISLLVVMALPLGFFFWNGVCVAQATHALKGEDIPVPPEQAQPWTPPPTKLPPVVVGAITELFKDGLPDPRGCEYREIEISQAKRWTIKTHGWVIPGTGKQRYAIGWNGVIYPIVSTGARVDLPKEMFAWSTTDGAGRFRGNGNGWPMSDQGSLRVESPLPIKVAFLLRLGYAKLAEDSWNEGYAGDDAMKTKDPYPDMAVLWLGRWFNQAMEAYLRGDYATCLSICQAVSAAKTSVDAGAARRGLTSPEPDNMKADNLWQLVHRPINS